jgi:hypothetical protein
MQSTDLREASPDTLPGSFSNDLVASKQWLCNYIKLLQKKSQQPFSTITVLGSWYGNLGLLLDKNNILFNKLILIDIDKNKIDISKTALGNMKKYKILQLVQDANDHVYSDEHNQLVINTSCNDIVNSSWLENIPARTLVALQGRNALQSALTQTDYIFDFDELFPLQKTLFLKEKQFKDPETEYTRFMKIGIK